jgi:hypothetical protein
MRALSPWWFLLAAELTPWAGADEITAGPATSLSVTVYRAPDRSAASIDLNDLQGFALVSETRTISIPSGESRVRFAGVADGIDSNSAMITGLPIGIVEKNRDARVLSPSELVAAALGHSVVLVRTNRKTGESTRVPGTIRSDADGGVVFESAQGIEALRCSGLPETFTFSAATSLGASPTLSVLMRSPTPISASVTLSYLTDGFDWSANYVATLSPDARRMDIGAWVTLANSNAVTFRAAHTQIVAGRLNRESEEHEPAEHTSDASQILATCWPRGTTSDSANEPAVQAASAAPQERGLFEQIVVTAAMPAAAPAAAALVQQEQLGDLKLYRVPEPTDVSSRQMKQVRLLDRRQVPVELRYKLQIDANVDFDSVPARRVVRTKNDAAHHLGLPLPSGAVATSIVQGNTVLLLSESPIRDVALDEGLEIAIGDSPDVQVSAVAEQTRFKPETVKNLPLLPGVLHLRSAATDIANRIEIHNARPQAILMELRLNLKDGTRLIGAIPVPAELRDRPLFKLTVPANASATIRYQTEHSSVTTEPLKGDGSRAKIVDLDADLVPWLD